MFHVRLLIDPTDLKVRRSLSIFYETPTIPLLRPQTIQQSSNMAQQSPVQLLFGAGGIGEGNISHTWTTGEQTSQLLDALKDLGLNELDSGAIYPPGSPWTTERLLGESKAAEKNFVIDTKILFQEGSYLLKVTYQMTQHGDSNQANYYYNSWTV